VWWVELAGLHDGGMVAVEVARVLGFQISPARPALETVVDVLRDQSLLLLLDNCEHLLASIAPLVLAIAREAPGIRVLTTTIEPLKIDGEQRFRLEPLALPTEPGVAGAAASCAVQLFVERVRAVDPRFALTPANVERVVAICRRLDAIPLALEFAAARVPLLGVEGVHARLDERFRILTGGSRSSLRRHQTLRAALDFSHALLTAEEQACFRRLGVFAGSFAVETAQDVAADAVIDRWDVLDHLGALVDKSMVLAEHEGERPRLRLLETARAYALEKLAEAGETATVQQRHAQALAATMAEAHESFWRWPDAARVARYAPEVDDLRAAIDWALDHDAERAIELCGNAGLLWMSLEMHPEGVRYCEAAVARASPSTPPLAHGRLWHAFAWMLVWCQPDRSRVAAARAAALLRETGDTATLGMALLASIPRNQPPDAQQLAAILDVERLEDSAPPTVQAVRCSRLARLHRNAGRYAEARRAYAEGAALLAGAGATSFELTLQWMTGEVALIVGDGAAAVASLRETVRRRSAQQFRGMYLALALGSLATAELCQGEIEAARAHLAEAAPLLVRFEIGGRYAATAALLAASEGRWAAAAQLLGFGEAAAAAHPSSRNEPTERIAAERAQALLAANLSTDAIAAATAEGTALTAAQAYARALAADDGEIASPRS
jgi:predicted ATPase